MQLLLNKHISLAVAMIVVIVLASCAARKTTELETDLQRESRFFNAYMKEIFPSYELVDGEYLFILPNGCTNCTKSTCSLLTIHPDDVRGKYNAIIISRSTLDNLSEDILVVDTNFLIDNTNKLDKMAFDIAGVAVFKIKDKQVVAKKSMTSEDFQKDPAEFFKPM